MVRLCIMVAIHFAEVPTEDSWILHTKSTYTVHSPTVKISYSIIIYRYTHTVSYFQWCGRERVEIDREKFRFLCQSFVSQ